MSHFTTKHASSIASVLSGFDRLVFRGTLRRLSFVEGMECFLKFRGLLLKDFGDLASEVTEQVKVASTASVRALGRPVIYMTSSGLNKEEMARGVALEHGIQEGPICVLSSVEPCNTFDIFRNKETKHIELVSRRRKCLFLYHYMIHPTFGFMNARIQTWFPFSIQICINGREWLARQMSADGLAFARHDNCFVYLESPERAQELAHSQLASDWPCLLTGVARALNPLHDELFAAFCSDYYWSTHQSEWATDILFKNPDTLRSLYPKLVRHGITTLSSPDVMRFLGHKLYADDRFHTRFDHEVVSDVKTREEGIRIKHRVGSNSVKAYDKAYTADAAVLRVETTMNDVSDFKVFRTKEGDSDGPRSWRIMRKGVADLARRAQISQSSNERYLNALSTVDENMTLEELMHSRTGRTFWKGHSVRALRPFEAGDAKLLAAVSRGEFAINGLRNRDIQTHLFGPGPTTPQEARRRTSQVTRLLGMLRAHGILAKVPHTHRYQMTAFGRQYTTAISAAKNAPIRQLLAA